ncbi:hypothetical protein ENBRE01_1805 [Enteropsectra breve]|nr:hypothetical protein ENBRE01_1805 [Enteropsectra breve]
MPSVDLQQELQTEDAENIHVNSVFTKNSEDPACADEEMKETTEDKVTRALMFLAPKPLSKEAKLLLTALEASSLAFIFNRIFSRSKLSNKELVHFLHIFSGSFLKNRTEENIKLIDVAKIVDFKFPSQDKYLDRLVLVYFEIINKILPYIPDLLQNEILNRYIYLFENRICKSMALYRLFSGFIFASDSMIREFVSRGMYRRFPFLKEFILDLSEHEAEHNAEHKAEHKSEHKLCREHIIKIGYECSDMRHLVYSILVHHGHSNLDWLAHHWEIERSIPIPVQFYRYDALVHMENLAENRMKKMINKDPKSIFSERAALKEEECFNSGNHSKREQPLILKNEIQHLIKMLNENNKETASLLQNEKNINLKTKFNIIKASKDVDLKSLGRFLCKEENYSFMEQFALSFHFQGLCLLESLRVFLSSFYMNGESQIIERVIKAFVRSWMAANDKEESLFPLYKSLSYSFIALNTMLHNPSIEKRPSFEDYLRLVEWKEKQVFDYSTMLGFYSNIKADEIKFPTAWTDSYEVFLSTADISSSFNYNEFSLLNSEDTIGEKINLNNEITMRRNNKSHQVCEECAAFAYCHIWNKISKDYFSMEPSKYFWLSEQIEILSGYKDSDFLAPYVLAQNDTGRAISAFALFIRTNRLSKSLLDKLISNLANTFKPKTSLFYEFKSIFNINKMATSMEHILSRTGKDFVSAITEFISMDFPDRSMFNSNIEYFYMNFYNANHNVENTHNVKSHNTNTPNINTHNEPNKDNLSTEIQAFIKDIFRRIVLNNHAMLDNLNFLDRDVLVGVVEQAPDKIALLSDENKLLFLESKNTYSRNEYDVFRGIDAVNEHSFDVFCKMGREYGYRDFINLKEESLPGGIEENKSRWSLGPYSCYEKYAEYLKSEENLIKMYKLSDNIWSVSRLSAINSEKCCMEEDVFQDYECFAYMVLKCSIVGGERLHKHMKYVLMYLSESMILLVRCIDSVYGAFALLDGRIIEVFRSILIQRYRRYSDTRLVCCRANSIKNDRNNEGSSESMAKEIEGFYARLVEHGVLSSAELGLSKEDLDVVNL